MSNGLVKLEILTTSRRRSNLLLDDFHPSVHFVVLFMSNTQQVRVINLVMSSPPQTNKQHGGQQGQHFVNTGGCQTNRKQTRNEAKSKVRIEEAK